MSTRTRETILSIIALATLLAFLGTLVAEVPRLDLGMVVGVTVLFVVWDVFTTHRNSD